MLQIIRRLIEESPRKAVRFHDYMSQCLYAPGAGYYERESVKLGKEGDFYTSSSLGAIMGEIIAAYIASRIHAYGWTRSPEHCVTIAEWGGGEGRLARQVLDELRLHHIEIYEQVQYLSIEKSAYHRKRQAVQLAEHGTRFSILTEEEFRAGSPWDCIFVLSNELLDAFPVYRIRYKDGQWQEQHVVWDDVADSLAELWLPLTDSRLLRYITERRLPEREQQQFEINLDGMLWLGSILQLVDAGEVITIDYGETAEELFAEHRMKGTLMCYRRHVASDRPLLNPGEQDMTAHVNFTDLQLAGSEAGVQETLYMTQKQFLLDNGLLGKLTDYSGADPFSPEARRNRSIRQLLLSDQMSELFKVLIQRKKGSR